MSENIFPKIVPYMRSCGKMLYSQIGHRRQYNKAIRFVCWIIKVTDTHSEHVILIAFLGKSGYAN